MNLSDIETMLIAIAPSVTAFATIVCGIASIKRSLKKKDKDLAEEEMKHNTIKKDIAIIKSKLTSIESTLIKKEE